MPHVTIRMAMAAGLALGAGLLAGIPIATQAQPSAVSQLSTGSTPAASYSQGRSAQAPSGGTTPAATAQPIPGSTLAAIVSTLPDGKQQALLIDGERRVVSVYHIHPTSGEISLKAVRNFKYDLEMDEFGTSSPSPRDIKAMLNR